MKLYRSVLALLSATLATSAIAAEVTVPMNVVSSQNDGASVGSITVKETKYGLLFTPDLHNLKPGVHGFHVHQNPSCLDNGMAAGGHLDPRNTNKHLGPYGDGHLGDLPVLIVAADGTATLPVLAPRLSRLSTIKNHSLMIHDGGDNYADIPAPLGGGGTRMECGVIGK